MTSVGFTARTGEMFPAYINIRKDGENAVITARGDAGSWWSSRGRAGDAPVKLIDWLCTPPRWLIPIFALPIAACAHQPVTIKVPVPVPCIAKDHAPVRPEYPAAQAEDGLFARVQKLLAEVELRKAYEGELEAQLKACE